MNWSPRAYVDEIAAIKAWNRATGKRFHGTEGGWIYRTSDNRRICQGWWKLAQRVGLKLERTEDGRYRYSVRSGS